MVKPFLHSHLRVIRQILLCLKRIADVLILLMFLLVFYSLIGTFSMATIGFDLVVHTGYLSYSEVNLSVSLVSVYVCTCAIYKLTFVLRPKHHCIHAFSSELHLLCCCHGDFFVVINCSTSVP